MPNSYSEEEIEYLKKNYPTKSNEELSEKLGRSKKAISMKASRMGLEKKYSPSEYRSSSTLSLDDEYLDSEINFNEYESSFIGGLITAEGSFGCREDDNGNIRFVFSIGMSEKDAEIIQFICKFFESGNDDPYHSNNKRENQENHKKFMVQSKKELIKEIIPFMEQYLYESGQKWKQYEEWRDKLIENVGVEINYK